LKPSPSSTACARKSSSRQEAERVKGEG